MLQILQDFRYFHIKSLQNFDMKPKKSPQRNRQHDLFRSELANMIDPNHPLVHLSKAVDWKRLKEVFGETYCLYNGRPVISTRLMVALHYLKYTYDLSDERSGPRY